jgi:hypothetical protein
LKRKRVPLLVPEEIPDAEHELVIERVCAIDVAKAFGKVCARSPAERRRVSKVFRPRFARPRRQLRPRHVGCV